MLLLTSSRRPIQLSPFPVFTETTPEDTLCTSLRHAVPPHQAPGPAPGNAHKPSRRLVNNFAPIVVNLDFIKAGGNLNGGPNHGKGLICILGIHNVKAIRMPESI